MVSPAALTAVVVWPSQSRYAPTESAGDVVDAVAVSATTGGGDGAAVGRVVVGERPWGRVVGPDVTVGPAAGDVERPTAVTAEATAVGVAVVGAPQPATTSTREIETHAKR